MNIIEIGAGDFQSCHCKKFISLENKVILFEPNSALYHYLADGIGNAPNVKLFANAVANLRGTSSFINLGLASWLRGAQSFTMLTQNLKGDTYDWEHYYRQLANVVEVIELEDLGIDNIDYLSLNCNGSEMDILNTLKTCPKVIRVCYYMQTVLQIEYYQLITSWAQKNNYKGRLLNTNRTRTFFEIEFFI